MFGDHQHWSRYERQKLDAHFLFNSCPGIPKNDPPYKNQIRKGELKREAKREARAKHIEECMAKMPQLVADYRNSRRIKWEDVTPADKLLLTTKQIRFKYVYKKMMNK